MSATIDPGLFDLIDQLAALDPKTQRKYLDSLTAPERRALDQALGQRWRRDPSTFAAHLDHRFKRWRYVSYLAEKYRQAVEGESIRQLWMVPFRYGKTELASVYGPAWALDRYPHLNIILSSYGHDLALKNSARVRDVLDQHDLNTKPRHGSRGKERWETEHGGQVMAAGVGGALTGFGGDLALVDDAHRNWQDAASQLKRDTVWDWFRSVLYTRLQTDTSAVIVLGCIVASMKVAMSDGTWREIQHVKPGESVWAWGGSGLTKRTVLDQRRSGVGDTLTIKTRNGSIGATPTHPFLVVPSDGRVRPAFKPEWRKASELKVGDLLVTAASLDTDGKPPVPGWDTDERMWLLGFLFGDGWVTSWARRNYDKIRDRYYESRSWALCIALGVDEALNDRVADAVEGAFGRRPKRMPKPRYWRLDSNSAGRELDSLGLHASAGAKGKRIPDWVFGTPVAGKRAFLRGFIDADGSPHNRGRGSRIELANPELINDLRLLALSCGVRPGNVCHRSRLAQAPNSPEPTWSVTASCSFVFPGEDDDSRIKNRSGASLVKGDLPDDVRVVRIQSIEPGITQDVYDLAVDGDESFVVESFIVHNTRWHEDDLAGRILASEDAHLWDVVRLTAIAEDPDLGRHPWERQPDPLGRQPGEVLEPERFSAETVEQQKRMLGSYLFGAMMQARPAAAEGEIIKRSWWKWYVARPAQADDWLMAWDASFKDTQDGSYCVGALWARVGANYYLCDLVRDRMDYPTFRAAVASFAARWPQCRKILVEDKANGPAVIADLRGRVAGLIARNPQGSKESRVHAISGTIEAGNVWLPDPSVNDIDPDVDRSFVHAYVEELSAFPTGSANDDQVDVTTMALLEWSNTSIDREPVTVTRVVNDPWR